MSHTETRKRNKHSEWGFEDEPMSYWNSATAPKNAHWLSGNCIPKCYGLWVFQPCNECIFFSIYLLLVGTEWRTFPPTLLSVCVSTALVSIVIWQYKTSCAHADRQRQSFFQRIFICHHHLHWDAEEGMTEWLVLSVFWYIFLWMAVPENTIFEIK